MVTPVGTAELQSPGERCQWMSADIERVAEALRRRELHCGLCAEYHDRKIFYQAPSVLRACPFLSRIFAA